VDAQNLLDSRRGSGSPPRRSRRHEPGRPAGHGHRLEREAGRRRRGRARRGPWHDGSDRHRAASREARLVPARGDEDGLPRRLEATDAAVRPLRATLHAYRWDCASSAWSDSSATAQPEAGADALETSAGEIRLAGPGRLGTGWLADDGTLLPDRSPGAEPAGACRGSAPTWRIPIGNVGPAAVTEAGLRTFAAELSQPIFWAGARAGLTPELTRTGANGSVCVRYLPPGVAVGASRKLDIVATYPLRDGYSVTLLGGKRPGAVRVPVDGATAYYQRAHPTNVYVAFPGKDFQIEVYAPAARTALDLVASGRIRPVGS
jgi:hypothetical protein